MGRTLQISDEERERRRERARQLHQEGKFGGDQGGRRPRNVRASELIAQKAQEHSDKVVKVFLDAIDPKQPITVRLQAATKWLEAENKEAALQLKEEREAFAKKSPDELLAGIVEMFDRLKGQGVDLPVIDVRAREALEG